MGSGEKSVLSEKSVKYGWKNVTKSGRKSDQKWSEEETRSRKNKENLNVLREVLGQDLSKK